MARNNYKYAKRQRDLAKKKKKDEKRERKLADKNRSDETTVDDPDETNPEGAVLPDAGGS